MSAADITQAKADLRRAAKVHRALLDPATRQAASLAIAANCLEFLGSLAKPGTLVGGFMPIGQEISPLPLMTRLHTGGCWLALPVMMGKNAPLEFRSYTPGDSLVAAVWGIREPGAAQPAVHPDVLLTALLAFDDAGYRLGYGGGYYDRSIRMLRTLKPVITIGLAYDEQRVDAVPHLDYDERLDWILTPSGARQIGS